MPRVAFIVLVVAIAAFLFWQVVAFASHSEPTVTIYDASPTHVWNRLYAALMVRQDQSRASFGENSLDPLLLDWTRHLLEPQSHKLALQVLDEFLRTHAENQIHDPVKRALFARDLWSVFDWSVAQRQQNTESPAYDEQKRELQIRLAEVLHRLALTPQEIDSLPDNYAQSVASGEFPKEYDPAHPERAFLPSDLFDQHGPWVEIHAGDGPPAKQHVFYFSGRSRFLIFIRLPGGRKAAFDYLKELWKYPQPFVARSDAPLQSEVNPALPTFPSGTEVALVRQMTMFDNMGNLRPGPITESVQIRVYRNAIREDANQLLNPSANIERSGQLFYELRLDRARLFAGKAGGLREVAREEKELFMFNAMPFDQLDDPKFTVNWDRIIPVTRQCVMCHREPGIRSLNSLTALLKPNSLLQDAGNDLPPRWWENDGTTDWKQTRNDWGLLQSYWKASTVHH
jgi:hypothetical protein